METSATPTCASNREALTGRRWLARDLSALVEVDAGKASAQNAQGAPSANVYDVVIVGSGYGGAMAAAELAGYRTESGALARVCVLERGQEYTPGMFPSSMAEIPNHVRFRKPHSEKPTGPRSGLLDFRLGQDVNALVANGLGGGSLINAGVMEKPKWDTFNTGDFPAAWVDALDTALLDEVKGRLGAASLGVDNTMDLHPDVTAKGRLAKTKALESLAPGKFRLAALTVAMQPQPNLSACTLCGDCLTGCNAGAKKSLDTTLLAEAFRQGAEIYTGASVMHLTREKGLWVLQVVYTDERLRLRSQPLQLRAKKVVLAAGTLGSTEILLRTQALSQELKFSPLLGQKFSCNGDSLAAVYQTKVPAHGTADEHVPFSARRVGPTITGMLETVGSTAAPGFLVQEFAVPGLVKRLFEECLSTSALLHRLAKGDVSTHRSADPDSPELDPCAVEPDAVEHSMMLGFVGHDAAQGVLRVPAMVDQAAVKACEGALEVDWPEARHGPALNSAYRTLGDDARESHAFQPGGRVLPNPLWRMLPDDMEQLVAQGRGPVLTVHPLGGCPMGESFDTGVVNDLGCVFGVTPSGLADWSGSLVVLDGSVLPGSIGVNPALTIAATALRACRVLRTQWRWGDRSEPVKALAERPRYRSVDACQPGPSSTEVEIIERLSGPVELLFNQAFVAEITLCFQPFALPSLVKRLFRRLDVRAASGELGSQLRLYPLAVWQDQRLRFAGEAERAQAAVFVAALSGDMRPFNRQASSAFGRTLRAWIAWVFTRGLRDGVQQLQDKWAGLDTRKLAFWKTVCDSWRLASRAGEVRSLVYDLTVGKVSHNPFGLAIAPGARIAGNKQLTYAWRTTPLQQLMELQVTRFPGTATGASIMLKLDNRFVAEQGIPLLRITRQANQVNALVDMAALGFYLSRLMLSVHLWTFRKPDRGSDRQPTLLPGIVQGLPAPEITEVDLDEDWRGRPVRVRLTRYRGKQADALTGFLPKGQCPLVFIHGYSAGGNTFTHNAIHTPAARYFHDQGRDIWVLDLRTSPGMPTATRAWKFEDAALADIPVAIMHIRRATGAERVDVFAHCIGAVMVSMGLLTDYTNIDDVTQYAGETDTLGRKRYLSELVALPKCIRRLVLSQKGPALVYSDENLLRAYLLRGLRKLVLSDDYQFRARADAGLSEQLMDRLLSALPYPREEIGLENPIWPFTRTPWVGLRHRMDLLYGRDFRARSISAETLGAMEDLFGPINLDTVAQAIHFATNNRITNASGRNAFVEPNRMHRRWGELEKTLSIHGEDNGLADVETLNVMQALMDKSGLGQKFERQAFPGFGHQDCLIGIHAATVFERVEEFLRDTV